MCLECHWRVTKNPLRRVQQNKIKQSKARQGEEEEEKRCQLNLSETVSLLTNNGPGSVSLHIRIRISVLNPYWDDFELDLLGLYANVNDIVSILMLVCVRACACFFSMWFHSAPFSDLITTQQHSPRTQANMHTSTSTNTQRNKQNRCVSCHSVAFSQLSAKSNRIESNDESVRGGFPGKSRLVLCVVTVCLVPAKSENKSLYVVVFDQVCFVFCLDLCPARLLYDSEANEHANTFDCCTDSSFRRRFMLNQDKFVVTSICEYIFRSQSVYLHSMHTNT